MPEVLVQFDKYKGVSVIPDMERVFVVGPRNRDFRYGRLQASRTMLPLVAAYAMTIHKSQGQTLKKIIINPGNAEFSTGMLYTAVSRVRSLEDIAFDSTVTENRLKAFATTGYKAVVADDAEERRISRPAVQAPGQNIA